MASDYDRLVAKVDETVSRIARTTHDELACAPGCAACCHVELELTRVEADAVRAHLEKVDEPTRRRIAARSGTTDGRCVMLDDHDRCAVFEVRPIVCRTQGLPLLYPESLVPVEAILRRTDRGAITACPLNFRHRAPEPDEAIDAERLDTLLGLVDRLDAERRRIENPARVAIRALARELESA